MSISGFSQVGYPKMTVSAAGDTCVIISAGQLRHLNKMHLQLVMSQEIIDSLLVNDSMHFHRENLLLQSISARDSVNVGLNKIVGLQGQQIVILQTEVDKAKRQKKLFLGGGIAIILTLLLLN